MASKELPLGEVPLLLGEDLRLSLHEPVGLRQGKALAVEVLGQGELAHEVHLHPGVAAPTLPPPPGIVNQTILKMNKARVCNLLSVRDSCPQ